MAVDIAAFRKGVYEVVASIPSGRVLSYGKIAWLLAILVMHDWWEGCYIMLAKRRNSLVIGW